MSQATVGATGRRAATSDLRWLCGRAAGAARAERHPMTKMPSLPELRFGPASRHGSVTVLPVFAAAPPVAPVTAVYDLGADAMGRGDLEVHEGGGTGQLEARNRGPRAVLFVEGDHLLGAKQNRMVTSTVLVGGGRSVAMPVSCVEQGRNR